MRKILVILAMLVAVNVNAQWVQMSNGITGEAVVVTSTTGGNNIYIGTWNPSTTTGGIFHSTNYGGNWTQSQFVNLPVTAIAVNGNYLYAGASGNSDSGVYVSSNNGLSWTHSSLNNRYIYALSAYGNSVYAGAMNHGVYLSTNNGLNWNQIGLSTKDVHCVALNGSILYAGVEGTGLYYSTDNGVNWTQTALNDKSVFSIAFSGNTIYAGTLQNGVYISTNNGSNWSQSALNNKTIYSLLVNGSNIFAGINYNGTGGVYISTNSGTSWLLKTQGFTPSTLGVVALVVLNNYIFAGTNYSVWRRSLSEIIGIQNISTETPSKYSLSQNYPNPFNPTTKIRFDIPRWRGEGGWTTLKVYDIQGREVQTLVNERLQAGTYETTFNGSGLNSGVYFYKLIIRHGGSSTGTFSETKKMLMIK